MKKERDSFFSGYGVSAYNTPMPYMYPNPNMNMNNYNDYNNDYDARISKLEREMSNMDTRLSNLENKFMTPQNTTNNTDYNFANSMYMV